jgi:5-methylcytosine-specific restriction protein A
MSRLRLLRPCIGCKRTVRGKTRCADCQRQRDQLKAQRRPDLHNDAAERRRRAAVVADHRAIVGDWCPGWAGRPAHPSADLTADHVKEVGAGGRPAGRLVVRCRSCNSAKAAAAIAIAARRLGVSPQDGQPATPRPSQFPTDAAADFQADLPRSESGPVVA